jgi:hypothetical protein
MSQPSPAEQKILKSVLEPLLKDFEYWFSLSRNLLESERISFLSEEAQADLLERVKQSQQQVATAQLLFQATEGKTGIEMAVIVPWHHLATDCWQISHRWRSLKSGMIPPLS